MVLQILSDNKCITLFCVYLNTRLISHFELSQLCFTLFQINNIHKLMLVETSNYYEKCFSNVLTEFHTALFRFFKLLSYLNSKTLNLANSVKLSKTFYFRSLIYDRLDKKLKSFFFRTLTLFLAPLSISLLCLEQ